MGSTKAKPQASKRTKPASKRTKQASNSKNGNNSGILSSADEFNHVVKPFLSSQLLTNGLLETKILIGLSYLGSSTLTRLKLDGHIYQTIYNSALNLTKKGFIYKVGGIYELTEQGRSEVLAFIEKYRIHLVA